MAAGKSQAYESGSGSAGGCDEPPEFPEVALRALRVAGRQVHGLPPWMDGEAFLGEALLAVTEAARTYRPELGMSFPDYAVHRVRYALADEARRQDPVGRRRRARLRSGLEPERPEDLPPASLELLLAQGEAAPACWDLDPEPGPEEQALKAEEAARVRAALARLTPRQRQVLILRYWERLTLAAIARALDLSVTRVHQLERGAVNHLRDLLQPPAKCERRTASVE